MFRFVMIAVCVLAAAPDAALANAADIPAEVFVESSSVIVYGVVSGRVDSHVPDGMCSPMETAVIQVKLILKGPQGAKEVRVLQQPPVDPLLERWVPPGTRNRIGDEGVWLLHGGPKLYHAGYPGQFLSTRGTDGKQVIEGTQRLLASRATMPVGRKVNGVVARAELVRGPKAVHVLFSLKNVSDKPVTICVYEAYHDGVKARWVDAGGKTVEPKAAGQGE